MQVCNCSSNRLVPSAPPQWKMQVGSQPSQRECIFVGDQYTIGKWTQNQQIPVDFAWLYTAGGDGWEPHCDDVQSRFLESKHNQTLTTAAVPGWLKRVWTQQQCDLLPFNRDRFCRVLNGQTIGNTGDSTMQQFAHANVGLCTVRNE